MITHSLTQGSPEWLAYRAAHFNASDAPAMLGISPYKTRSQLMHEMATGMAQEVDSATQRRFDAGHRFEALARPLAEKIIGEELFPVTGSEGKLSASFDGLTMMEDVCWEHKTINAALRAVVRPLDLPEHYRAQMEQQLMISSAGKCLFTATSWADDGVLIEAMSIWYSPHQDMRDRIINGWTQFAADLAAYVPAEVIPAAIATPAMGLPALSIQVNGSVSLISNLDRFGAELNAFVGKIDMQPTDDQGFADAEAACKTLQQAQDALESAEASALAQTASIDDMRRAVKLYADTARTARLALEKMVKSRKESIRAEIAAMAREAFAAHVDALNNRLKRVSLHPIATDFPGVMKGKKLLSNIRDAVDTELARAKIEASAMADKFEINLNSLSELAKDHKFLFADFAQLVGKANDDLVALIRMRIADHQEAEAKRIDAERQRIQQEEHAKAEAKIHAELEAKASAEREDARIKAEAARVAGERAILDAAKAIRPAELFAPEALRAVVVEHQDEVREFLNTLNVSDEKKNMVRAYIMEFVKFQAARAGGAS